MEEINIYRMTNRRKEDLKNLGFNENAIEYFWDLIISFENWIRPLGYIARHLAWQLIWHNSIIEIWVTGVLPEMNSAEWLSKTKLYHIFAEYKPLLELIEKECGENAWMNIQLFPYQTEYAIIVCENEADAVKLEKMIKNINFDFEIYIVRRNQIGEN